jgi:hypothetical protein
VTPPERLIFNISTYSLIITYKPYDLSVKNAYGYTIDLVPISGLLYQHKPCARAKIKLVALHQKTAKIEIIIGAIPTQEKKNSAQSTLDGV